MTVFSQYIKKQPFKIAFTAFFLILLMFGMAKNASADVLFTNGNYSIEGSAISGGFNFQTAIMNNNSPVSFTGTIYYLTLYSPDVNATDLQISNGSTPQHTEVATCSVPVDMTNDGTICDGSSNSSLVEVGFGNIQTSVDGNFITFELITPLSVTAGDYLYIRALSHSNIRFSGYDTSSCYTATANLFDCPNGFDAMYAVLSGVGGFVPPVETTRIIDFTPADNSTTTSPVDFELNVYINADDLTFIKGVKLTFHNIDQNVIFGTITQYFNPNDVYLLNAQATTSGFLTYNFDDIPLGDGNYRIEACIERTLLYDITGFWSNFSDINDCQSHQFIVGQATFIGNISQQLFTDTNDFFEGLNSTSSEALASTCNPLNTNFGIRECSAFLLIPDASNLKQTLENARDGFLDRVPFGYFGRFYDIMAGGGTTTLPDLIVNIPVGGDLTEFNLTPFVQGALEETQGLLENDMGDSGRSIRDVLEDILIAVMAVTVIAVIITDIVHSGRGGGGTSGPKKST